MRLSRTAARRNCSAAVAVAVEGAASPGMFAIIATAALRADLATEGVFARTCEVTPIRMRRTRCLGLTSPGWVTVQACTTRGSGTRITSGATSGADRTDGLCEIWTAAHSRGGIATHSLRSGGVHGEQCEAPMIAGVG